VLTRRETEAPTPKKSGRRRNGETRARQFTRAAARTTRPAQARAGLLWLADTLDWLNLWQSGGTELTDDVSQSISNNHLSPRL
jgi:hypothetical protein